MTKFKESPSQTAGPYVHIGCTPNFAEVRGVYDADLGAVMKTGAVRGEEITIRGTVFDGDGAALVDAMIEIWQADADGLHAGHDDGADPNFTGWGRTAGDMETGEFVFETVMPGQVAGQAPHVTFWIVARGINLGLQTRMYFAGDSTNEIDPILSQIDDARKQTLLATKETDGSYRFDIHLQGDQETVFFDM